MESQGVRVDTKLLSDLSEDYSSKIKSLEEESHELAEHAFSLSSPLQVRTVLFEEQGLPVVKRTKTGPSTDAEVLEELASLHELPAKLLQHRKYSKLKSTYVDALPFLVDPRTGGFTRRLIRRLRPQEDSVQVNQIFKTFRFALWRASEFGLLFSRQRRDGNF